MHKPFLLIIFIFLFSSCEVKVNTGGEVKNNVNPSKIKNGIQLNSKGLKVSQAFLLYESGKFVPDSNVTSIGEKVRLRLIIEEGWKVVNGKVQVGASERIETNDGKVVLDEADLFSSIPEGVTKEDAQYITLSAVISRLDRLYDYFIVKFRVWDKNTDADVSGSYKLYIK